MILVCAATGLEAAACRRGVGGAPGFEVLATGVGPARAGAALARRLASGARPTLVVSSGFAGALADGVAPLAWVTASAVLRLEGGRAVPVALPPGLLRLAPSAAPCAVVSAPAVLAAPVPGVAPPAAADMESAALAEVAAAAGIPFCVLRVVTDTPRRPLAPAARSVAAALAACGPISRAAHGARAALDVARSPLATLGLAWIGLAAARALRDGWRGRARDGSLR